MIIRFIIQASYFGLFYLLLLIVTFPFTTIIGAPKPWQKNLEFMLFFPVSYEKIGVFWLPGIIAVIFLNGLLMGLFLVGSFRISCFLKDSINC